MKSRRENLQLPPGNKVLNKRVHTFNFMSKKFTVMHRDQRVAEEGAEEIEERDDAVGVFEGHGRPPGDQLQQSHRGAGGAGGINRNNRYFSTCLISGTEKQTWADRVDEKRSPRDHFGGHGRDQVPEVPQESSVKG